jgi:tRNA pseudouridine32 synthase/23S rRNA pseudouridine746 synthase
MDPCFTTDFLPHLPDGEALQPPDAFTYPFFYTPHPLVVAAAEHLQQRLQSDATLCEELLGGDAVAGKMLGVLVVKDSQGALGYLSAYSGKLNGPRPEWIVPAVADIHAAHTEYKLGEAQLNNMTEAIEALKRDPEFVRLKALLKDEEIRVEQVLSDGRGQLKQEKLDRKQRREAAKASLNAEAFEAFNAELTSESITTQLQFKKFAFHQKEELEKLREEVEGWQMKLDQLKKDRRAKSNALQAWIFSQYQFLNARGERKDIKDLFPDFEVQQPPSGAGDCSAPKLLQYAYLQGYEPLCMGEFWWGKEPKNEVRKQGLFYPSCNSRCRPILGHMLEGVTVEPNPLLSWSDGAELPIIYDDKDLVVVNKPEVMLSVPGKDIEDSALTRIKALYPEATGSVLLHRLDMSTSGILVFAKNPQAHKFVQKQFIKRTLKKQYIAVLDGIVEGDEGTIELPLRPDYYDLPRQMVCHEHGKPATTHWKVLERNNGKTRLALFPVTGRTHQLRVHCAHPDGLHTPIFGDELYGVPANRLHLHAASISFIHPTTKEEISFEVAPNF